MTDPYDLERFISAQEAAGTYVSAVRELQSGRKWGHWMWFVFPQIAGLGQSPTSRRYAIASAGEARAYLDHPVLGPRLLECARIVAGLTGVTAEELLGGIDAVKLRSSMTLFHRVAPENPLFARVLDVYFDGRPDPATDRLLADLNERNGE